MEGVTYWTEVCGNRSRYDAFWDTSISWNTPNPNLTKCFQDTVMVWVPCAILWLGCIFYIPYLCGKKTEIRWRGTSVLNIIKIILSVFLVLVSVVDLARVIYDDTHDIQTSLSQFLSPVIKTLTFILTSILIAVEFRKGMHTSGVFFGFWLLLIVAGIPTVKYTIDFSDLDIFSAVTFYTYYGLIVLHFVLSLIPDYSALPWLKKPDQTEEKRPLLQEEESIEKSNEKEPCPEASATFLSNITFFWATKLLRKGWKRALVFEDLYDLMDGDKSRVLVPKFQKYWKRALDKARVLGYGKPAPIRDDVMIKKPKKKKVPTATLR